MGAIYIISDDVPAGMTAEQAVCLVMGVDAMEKHTVIVYTPVNPEPQTAQQGGRITPESLRAAGDDAEVRSDRRKSTADCRRTHSGHS
jgi:hypothetical protein